MMFCKEHDPQGPHASWTKSLLLLCTNRKIGPETPKGFPGHTADSPQSSEAELTLPDKPTESSWLLRQTSGSHLPLHSFAINNP